MKDTTMRISEVWIARLISLFAISYCILTAKNCTAQTVYTTSSNSGNIWRTESSLSSLNLFATVSTPFAIKTDTSGTIYVLDSTTSSIRRFNPSGIELSPAVTGIGIATDFCIDNAGNIYLGSRSFSSVRKYSNEGTFLQSIGVAQSVGDISGMDFDEFGNLYIASNNVGRVFSFAPDGTSLGSFPVGPNPTGLAIDSFGNILVSTDLNVVERYGPDGTDLGDFVSIGLPRGIAVSNSGDVYVATWGVGDLYHFSSAGEQIGILRFFGDGYGVTIFETASAPEPGTLWLLTLAALGAVVRKRRA